MELDQTLASRDQINKRMREVIEEASIGWGVDVTRVELQAIEPPRDIQQSMELQMRAERERRAAVTNAEAGKRAAILEAEGLRESQVRKAEGEKKPPSSAPKDSLRELAMARPKQKRFSASPHRCRKVRRNVSARAQVPRGSACRDAGQGTTIFLPAEASGVMGALGGCGSCSKRPLVRAARWVVRRPYTPATQRPAFKSIADGTSGSNIAGSSPSDHPTIPRRTRELAKAITRERAERIARAHACEHCQEYSYKKLVVKPSVPRTRRSSMSSGTPSKSAGCAVSNRKWASTPKAISSTSRDVLNEHLTATLSSSVRTAEHRAERSSGSSVTTTSIRVAVTIWRSNVRKRRYP